jgi:NADPH:quinone reductase-like Zn-dependent oxidoreductase
MRAAVLKGYGLPLEDVQDALEPSKTLGPHEVLVNVQAAGVNPASTRSLEET